MSGLSQELATLRQRQSLPLEAKIRMSLLRIRDWYEYWDGDVYVSFSGGKDSRVLLDLVWRAYPDVPAVFSNTGLEYPEVVTFVTGMQRRYGDRVVVVRPKRTFRDVVLNEGFPIVSKKVAKQLRILREEHDNPNWSRTVQLYETGIRSDGGYSKTSQLPQQWRYLISAPYKISEKCCDNLKKEPLDAYAKRTGRKGMRGIMADEGGLRAKQHQCNLYNAAVPASAPMLFWTTADVWSYIRMRNLDYPAVYDMGEERTGCMFCGFGVHLEKGSNRFQRMAVTHPKQWNYCVNKLGMRGPLEFVGVSVDPEEATPASLENRFYNLVSTAL